MVAVAMAIDSFEDKHTLKLHTTVQAKILDQKMIIRISALMLQNIVSVNVTFYSFLFYFLKEYLINNNNH